MPRYECRFLDHGGNVREMQPIDAEDDGAAVAEAHQMQSPNIGAGFDIWHGNRRVHSHRNRLSSR